MPLLFLRGWEDMTIKEAITITDGFQPNQYTSEAKIRWLDALDGQIWQEVILTHEDAPESGFSGYLDDIDQDTALLVPEPYAADVYIPFLQARIDRENREIVKWNQSVVLFNSGYSTFCAWYNRNHRPIRDAGFLF